MKKLFLSVIVAFFVTNSFATAFNEDPKVVLVKTTKELSQLLNTRNHEGLLEANQMVKVLFTVNELKQIVVIQVNSSNTELHYFITNALNYKVLKSMELKVGEKYSVDLDFRI